MRIINRFVPDSGKAVTIAVAALFFAICTWVSYARWANFEYRTFDLAYYVQAIWQLVHGRLQVSVGNVPLLGNHVEPIVFLFAPIFAVFRHPMVFVVVQNAALATMGPIAYSIGRRLELGEKEACLLAGALLLTPATGYIALHEFHPEALSAPLLLLMFYARLSHSLGKHWLWFLAVLACKENMALLLGAYCAVQAIVERERGIGELRKWYLWPMGVAVLWFLVCSKVITPALNSGNIDYVALYDRLGTSVGDILLKAVTAPQRIGRALTESLAHGNLLWALLFPFLCLPLLRPRWLLIATPILLQHLLSWRSSEWTIYFHYGAPLLALFWMALAEAAANCRSWKPVPALVRRTVLSLLIPACIIAQIFWGPAAGIASTMADWSARRADRLRKNALISPIPSQASVVAPLPYLSHLAMREKLYSLHYILKGLKTLSRASYEPPPPTDFVLLDYRDSATFDASAGYYHPTMKTVDGRIIPSSDVLLHDFLKRASWLVNSSDELTLFRHGERAPGRETASGGGLFEIEAHTQLMSITKSGDVLSNRESLEVTMNWKFQEGRDVLPWMLLRLVHHGNDRGVVVKGLCAPEASSGPYEERWRVTSTEGLADGEYTLEAIFMDNSKQAWSTAYGQGSSQSALLSKPIPLGDIRIEKSVP